MFAHTLKKKKKPAEDCAWCPAEGAGPFQCGKPLGWNGWATRAGFTGLSTMFVTKGFNFL